MPLSEGVVVKVSSLKKYFELKKGFFSLSKEEIFVKAVDDVNFEIHEGEILGLVGESGCGKTTTGRLLTRLEDPTGGSVFFLGRDIALLEGDDLKVFRRNIQMVFQDPYESLNPRTTVLQTIMEPLINHNVGATFEKRVELVEKALTDAGLAPAREYLARFPHELSGGQRQRVSIARALVIGPRVIVADEPVSMLDVSIRAGVLNLMLDLRDKYHIPYLFITHDIAVARYVSDRLAVMYLGRVVELGETDEVIFNPKHPYTRALLSAVPVPDPAHKHGRITIKGEIPSATNIPFGCRFRTRCPFAFNECGWEGKDLAAFLMDQEKIGSPENPMNAQIEQIEPKELSLVVIAKEGGSTEKIRGYLERKVAEQKGQSPMFQAVAALGELIYDREILIPTSSITIPGEEVAKELLELLVKNVDFKSRGHPMYGRILNAVQQGPNVVIAAGPGVGGDQKGGTGKSGIETELAFVKDFVTHYKKTGYSEFKGVSQIAADGAGRIVVTCGPGKMSSKRVAEEAAEIIADQILYNPNSKFYNQILPLVVSKKGVATKVMGGPERWTELCSELAKHFDTKKSSGVRAAAGVGAPRVKTLKGPGKAVALRFSKTVEPPLADVGGGHLVSCYLFKPAAQ